MVCCCVRQAALSSLGKHLNSHQHPAPPALHSTHDGADARLVPRRSQAAPTLARCMRPFPSCPLCADLLNDAQAAHSPRALVLTCANPVHPSRLFFAPFSPYRVLTYSFSSSLTVHAIVDACAACRTDLTARRLDETKVRRVLFLSEAPAPLPTLSRSLGSAYCMCFSSARCSVSASRFRRSKRELTSHPVPLVLARSALSCALDRLRWTACSAGRFAGGLGLSADASCRQASCHRDQV